MAAKSKPIASTTLIADLASVREQIAVNSETVEHIRSAPVTSADVARRLNSVLAAAESFAAENLRAADTVEAGWSMHPKGQTGARIDDLGVTLAAKNDLLGLFSLFVGRDVVQAALARLAEASSPHERLPEIDRETELVRLADERDALERTEEIIARQLETLVGVVDRRGDADLRWVLCTDAFLMSAGA